MSADLATVDRQRRDLVASVSHELRTPLAALVAVLENLDDGVIAPDPETVHVARAQAERLGDLVDDLLDLSRLDAGVVPLDRQRAAGRSAPRVRGGRGEVRARSEPARRHLRGARRAARPEPVRRPRPAAPAARQPARQRRPAQPVRRRRLRLGRARGRVHPASRSPTRASASRRSDRERVFERFGTLPDSSGGGTGLGLAIARWVTDLHGGRIAVVDPVPGRDRCSLPRRAARRPHHCPPLRGHLR